MSADDQRSTMDVKEIVSAIPHLAQFVAAVINAVDPNSQPTATNGQLAFAIASGHRRGGISSSRTQSNAPNGDAGNYGDGRDEGMRPVITEVKCQSLFNQVDKLHRDLTQLERALQRLVSLEDSVGLQFGSLVRQSHELESSLKADPIALGNGSRLDASKLRGKEVQEKFRSLGDMVTQLKSQIPSMYPVSNQAIPHNTGKIPHFNSYYIVGGNAMADMRDKVLDCGCFRDALRDYESAYESLSSEAQPCLLCFSVFPENTVVRKRLLVYWWIGEGLINPQKPGDKTVDDVLGELIGKGFIEPVLRKRRVVGFRLDPLVRFAVIKIAEDKEFFCFDKMGVPTEKVVSPSFRVCLSTKELEEPSRRRLISNEGTEVEKLRTLFNVNDPYPDFKAEWFSKLRNLLVLHLGSLQDSAEHHIEVEDTEFLRGLKNMKRLKYLSLQGISRIVELPSSICSLSSLRVLDLNSCHNMELLPKSMGNLKQLTHLDISGCYLLDHIPKELNLLSELQVLKGFVIGDSGMGDACLLEDLTKLQKLKKLSITTGREDFPRDTELNVLKGFVALKNLTITWAVKSSKARTKKHSVPGEIPAKSSHATTVKSGGKGHNKKKDENPVPTTEVSQKAPAAWGKARTAVQAMAAINKLRTSKKLGKLEKLELQCFPGATPPVWLCEGRLKPHKKLYISGGNLQSLSPMDGKSVGWDVKILCLKFLSELRMEWSQLQKSFPKLIYLEKIKCPKLTFFPCDQSGVWINKALEDKDLGGKELQSDDKIKIESWTILRNSSSSCSLDSIFRFLAELFLHDLTHYLDGQRYASTLFVNFPLHPVDGCLIQPRIHRVFEYRPAILRIRQRHHLVQVTLSDHLPRHFFVPAGHDYSASRPFRQSIRKVFLPIVLHIRHRVQVEVPWIIVTGIVQDYQIFLPPQIPVEQGHELIEFLLVGFVLAYLRQHPPDDRRLQVPFLGRQSRIANPDPRNEILLDSLLVEEQLAQCRLPDSSGSNYRDRPEPSLVLPPDERFERLQFLIETVNLARINTGGSPTEMLLPSCVVGRTKPARVDFPIECRILSPRQLLEEASHAPRR